MDFPNEGINGQALAGRIVVKKEKRVPFCTINCKFFNHPFTHRNRFWMPKTFSRIQTVIGGIYSGSAAHASRRNLIASRGTKYSSDSNLQNAESLGEIFFVPIIANSFHLNEITNISRAIPIVSLKAPKTPLLRNLNVQFAIHFRSPAGLTPMSPIARYAQASLQPNQLNASLVFDWNDPTSNGKRQAARRRP